MVNQIPNKFQNVFYSPHPLSALFTSIHSKKTIFIKNKNGNLPDFTQYCGIN